MKNFKDSKGLFKPDKRPTDVLNDILKQLEPIDFRAEAEKMEGREVSKIQQKHFLIISVSNILKAFEQAGAGLALDHNFIYVYNGSFWQNVETETFTRFLGDAAEALGVPVFDAKFYEFKDRMLKQFLTDANLPAPKPKDKVLINLRNGTFEIDGEKTELRGFDSKDFLKYKLPFSYDPDATAPIFEKYINRVLPDISLQNILSEFLGYIFLKNLKLEKALVLYGSGANGKSVLFEIVTALLGPENTTSYSINSLTNERGGERVKIKDKLVNYASEVNTKLESSIFKQLVSGEPVEARELYKEPFLMTDYAKLIFNSNELPRDVEHTNAFFRRFLIVPFNVTIPDNEQDKKLHEKIINNELPGVFNWVLKGLERVRANERFTHSEASEKALNSYRDESDTVKQFVIENEYRATTEPDKFVLIKELYPIYRNFCIEDGHKPLSKRNFVNRLKSNGFDVGAIAGNKRAVFISNNELF